jgi:hypothetical protein
MVANFPPELILGLFQFFPLKSLFAAKGVNRQWHALVPTSDMLPARRTLYDLYHTIITSPAFLASRETVIQSLSSFDRKECVAAFEGGPGGNVDGRDRTLPDDFRCYILEWPEKAVFGWFWPGLHDGFTDTSVEKPYGSNCLGYQNRAMEEMFFFYPKYACPYPPIKDEDLDEFIDDMKDPNEVAVSVNGVQVWYHGCTTYSWLVVDPAKPELHGKVYTLDGCIAPKDVYSGTDSWAEWMKTVLNTLPLTTPPKGGRVFTVR